MTLITLREQQVQANCSFSAQLIFDHAEEFDTTIRDPFAAPEEAESEARLEWYFEHWLEFPFTDAVESCRKELARFLQLHMFGNEVAKLLSVREFDVKKWARDGTLKPISGPTIDGSCEYLFARHDIETLHRN